MLSDFYVRYGQFVSKESIMDIGTAFDFAANTTNQVIAISSAILALTVTFAGDHLTKGKTGSGLRVVKASWAVQLLSIVFGVLTLMAMTGQLASEKVKVPNVWEGNIVLFSSLQLSLFLIGLALLVKVAWSFKSE